MTVDVPENKFQLVLLRSNMSVRVLINFNEDCASALREGFRFFDADITVFEFRVICLDQGDDFFVRDAFKPGWQVNSTEPDLGEISFCPGSEGQTITAFDSIDSFFVPGSTFFISAGNKAAAVLAIEACVSDTDLAGINLTTQDVTGVEVNENLHYIVPFTL